jgi:hypothetical protein
MKHRGINYEITIAREPNEWVWVVHTPHQKQGSLKGTRDRAVTTAKLCIEAHCGGLMRHYL